MIFLSPFEKTVSKRFLSFRRQDGIISLTTILSVLAISIGIWALVFVSSVMNGFREQLLDTVLGYHGHVLVQSYTDRKITDHEALEADLMEVDGVVRTLPFVESFAMVTRGTFAGGAIVRGYPDNHFKAEDIGIKNVRSGSLEDALDVGGVVIGYELARRLGIVPGDTITLIPGKMVATPMGSAPRFVQFPVSAIVEIGVYQFDESFIGMPLIDAQVLFQMRDQISTIEIFLEDPEVVEDLEAEFVDVVGGRGHITHWKKFNASIVQALDLEKLVMFLVVALIVFVACFNITTSQIMSVKDRTGDIAILRTIGCSTGSIRRIFMSSGLAIGLFGILNGAFWATLWIWFLPEIVEITQFVLGIQVWDPSTRFITSLEARVNWLEVVGFVAMAVALSFFASLLPALRAAKTDPVDILRQE